MLIFPDYYVKDATKVSFQWLKKHQIKAILLDVDNTLIDFNHNILDNVEMWCDSLKKQGIQFCIVSNTNKIQKVEKIATILNIPYIYFATKPLKRGFRKAKELLKLDYQHMAVIGDQIFTDVLGANRSGMYSILVEPMKKEDIFITRIKRPLEKYILKKYAELQEKEGKK